MSRCVWRKGNERGIGVDNTFLLAELLFDHIAVNTAPIFLFVTRKAFDLHACVLGDYRRANDLRMRMSNRGAARFAVIAEDQDVVEMSILSQTEEPGPIRLKHDQDLCFRQIGHFRIVFRRFDHDFVSADRGHGLIDAAVSPR